MEGCGLGTSDAFRGRSYQSHGVIVNRTASKPTSWQSIGREGGSTQTQTHLVLDSSRVLSGRALATSHPPPAGLTSARSLSSAGGPPGHSQTLVDRTCSLVPGEVRLCELQFYDLKITNVVCFPCGWNRSGTGTCRQMCSSCRNSRRRGSRWAGGERGEWEREEKEVEGENKAAAEAEERYSGRRAGGSGYRARVALCAAVRAVHATTRAPCTPFAVLRCFLLHLQPPRLVRFTTMVRPLTPHTCTGTRACIATAFAIHGFQVHVCIHHECERTVVGEQYNSATVRNSPQQCPAE